MKSSDEVAVLCQARLGSQRVPRKMVRDFAGTTLLDVLFNKIACSNKIPWEHFWLSACEAETEIINIAKKYNVNIFPRSQDSASAETDLCKIYEWHDKLPKQYKYVVLVSACNPFLTLGTIENFYETYLAIKERGLFGVVEKRTYYWDADGVMITDMSNLKIMNTKLVSPVYEAAHCLYASPLDTIKTGVWMGEMTTKDPELFIIKNEFETLDIDHEWQFTMCENLYKE